MHAVLQVAGVQVAVEEGDVVKIPFQDADPGSKVDFEEILLIRDEGKSIVGTPTVADAKVEAEVVSHGQADKVLVYKQKRRTKYRRTQGHRQKYTEIKINKIVAPAN